MDCRQIKIKLNSLSNDFHNYYNKIYRNKKMSLLHNHDPKHVVSDKYSFQLRMLYYNKLLLHKIDKIKMAGTSRDISSVMISAANN